MKRGRRPGKGVGAWRGHPAALGSPGSVRRKRECARSGSRRGQDGTGGRDRRAGGFALSVTAPSGPVLPGRRCPWMRPPRAPRPVSVPAAGPARSPAPALPVAAASPALGALAQRSPPPAGASTPRAEAAPALWPGRGRRAGDGEPGREPRADGAARSGNLRLVGSRCISVQLFLWWGNGGHLKERGSPRASMSAFVMGVVVGRGGGYWRLWGCCARCRKGGTDRVTRGSKTPIWGSSRSTRRGPLGDERGNWGAWMGEVIGAPLGFNPSWKGMRRRALEDSCATAWGPKILWCWALGIQVAEAK